MKKTFYFLTLGLALFQGINANAYSNVKFYASNNSANNLTMQDAFNRLIGSEQINLENYFSNLMNGFAYSNKEVSMKSVLGAYHIEETHVLTADNSIVYELTGQDAEQLNPQNIIQVAQIAAVTLDQDSVAVFEEDSKGNSEDIILNFDEKDGVTNYKLKDLDNLIKTTLPKAFSDGYSVTLQSAKDDKNVNDATISAIEWLGTKNNFNVDSINKIIGFKNVSSLKIKIGNAFYVNKIGNKTDIQ